jgi:hypothetical protein
MNREVDQDELWDCARAFEHWLDATGYESYDPYDIWGTKYGLASRRLYYRAPLLGSPLIAPIVAMEMACPQLRRVIVRKQRFPTADAHLVLSFLNLYELKADSAYLARAENLAAELLRMAIPGFSGYCWGYPFDWQNYDGLYPKNVPYITCTPYCFEAYAGLHKATGNDRYLKICESIAQFIADDLKDSIISDEAAAASYSPYDATKVVNASAYRAFVLFEAAHRFGNDQFAKKAWRNLNFVLRSQREDGSWLYAMDSRGEAFIDHFHTCFVLKNLFKINRRLQDRSIRAAIQNGYGYYRRSLFDRNDKPIPFAIRHRTQIVNCELYDFAEAITLGVLLRDHLSGAFDLALELAHKIAAAYQLPEGFFVTRVYRGGLRHTFPFMRWPQAQLFYALTNVLIALKGSSPSIGQTETIAKTQSPTLQEISRV